MAYETVENRLWYAPLDQRMPPRPLADEVDSRLLDVAASSEIFFASAYHGEQRVFRTHADGTQRDLVAQDPDPLKISPDGQPVYAFEKSEARRNLYQIPLP